MSNLLTWNARSRTFARTATIGKRNGTNALLSRMDPTENATVTPLGRANPNFMTHVDPYATRVTRFHKNGGYPFHHSKEGCSPISSTCTTHARQSSLPKKTYNYSTTANPEPWARQVGILVFNTHSTSDHSSSSSSTSISTSVRALVAQTWHMSATCPNYEHRFRGTSSLCTVLVWEFVATLAHDHTSTLWSPICNLILRCQVNLPTASVIFRSALFGTSGPRKFMARATRSAGALEDWSLLLARCWWGYCCKLRRSYLILHWCPP